MENYIRWQGAIPERPATSYQPVGTAVPSRPDSPPSPVVKVVEMGAPYEVGASGGVGGVNGAVVAVGGAPFRRRRRTADALGFTINHRRRIW